MNQTKTMRPLVQSLAIIAAVMVLVTGVTFAALQSQQAVLKGNTIATAVAALKLSKDNNTWASTLDGYGYGSLIPGGAATPSTGNPIYLQNIGTSALVTKLSVAAGIANPDNVDLAKVDVILTPFTGGVSQMFTLQDLITADATGGLGITAGGANHLGAGATTGFMMQIRLEADAVSGQSAAISNLSFNFNGLAVN